MKQTWRWFGPDDPVTIEDVAQAGAQGIVTALHQFAPGEVWPKAEILKRQEEISRLSNGAPSGLTWDVVESLPVSEDIKKQSRDWRTHLTAYRASLENLADAGLEVVCYNFMPVLDWTRTALDHPLPNGATCMAFDLTDFAVFDIHILERQAAGRDYDFPTREAAARRFAEMTEAGTDALASNILAGLPGASSGWTLDDVRTQLAEYAEIDAKTLRGHLVDFLGEVVPTAEKLGLRLCCHPDDPPFPLLGLPRVMSTEADFVQMLESVPSPANGMTLCSGSLGARGDHDIVGMMERLGDRVHFLHLRDVIRQGDHVPTSFHEAEHLGGDTDMVALLSEVIKQESRRRASGRQDHSIPFRPDHGQNILDDLTRRTQPGYPAIGRLKGLAELRGVVSALEKVL